VFILSLLIWAVKRLKERESRHSISEKSQHTKGLLQNAQDALNREGEVCMVRWGVGWLLHFVCCNFVCVLFYLFWYVGCRVALHCICVCACIYMCVHASNRPNAFCVRAVYDHQRELKERVKHTHRGDCQRATNMCKSEMAMVDTLWICMLALTQVNWEPRTRPHNNARPRPTHIQSLREKQKQKNTEDKEKYAVASSCNNWRTMADIQKAE